MNNLLKSISIILIALGITACTPKFDWREIRNADAPFIATFPGKPATHSRDIELDGIKVKLHMTAADVNQLSFAIAYAKIENNDKSLQAQQQQRALSAMQAGMLKNIQGTIVQASTSSGANSSHHSSPKNTITAIGKKQNGQAIKMLARFTQHGPWVMQIVMMGEEKAFTPDIADMFFDSIKLN